jgi:hypothetical protein
LSYRPARIHRIGSMESILGLLKSLKIWALAGRYDNPIPTQFLAPIDCYKIPALVNEWPSGYMFYDELECTPSLLSLTRSSLCGASTPLPTLLGRGRGGELNQIQRRGSWVSFYLSIFLSKGLRRKSSLHKLDWSRHVKRGNASSLSLYRNSISSCAKIRCSYIPVLNTSEISFFCTVN